MTVPVPAVPPPEEAEARGWLAAAAAGDETALRRLYDRYAGAVYRFALARLGEPADAADVLNEVMLEVWRGAGRFRGSSAVRTWILGIAHHKTTDLLRRRGCEPKGTEAPDSPPCADQEASGAPLPAALADAELVRRCLEALSPVLRQAIYLAFYEDRAYSEIAAILDCPVGTVKTRVFHAKRVLRASIEALAAGTEPEAGDGRPGNGEAEETGVRP